MQRIVLDTNVLVAGLRSQRGAAYRVLSLLGSKTFAHVLSVALLFEYEDAVKRPGIGIRLPPAVVDDILDFICESSHRQRIHFLWRPTLPDSQDDMVLELAVEGRCDTVVTYNVRHFVGSERFGVRAMRPQQFLDSIGVKR